jgi:hypothetical protein
MDDFEAFRRKKLGKSETEKRQAPGDDFEAFRRAKLGQKARRKAAADGGKDMYSFAVEEEGKAKGLVSHRARRKDVPAGDVPEVKGFDSHISRSNLDPESIEKFQGKALWRDNRPEVDPDSVPKLKTVSHINKAKKVDPDSIDKPAGIKRF